MIVFSVRDATTVPSDNVVMVRIYVSGS